MKDFKSRSNAKFKLTGKWNMQNSLQQDRYSILSFSDLTCEPGLEENFLTRFELKINKNKEEVFNILKNRLSKKFN